MDSRRSSTNGTSGLAFPQPIITSGPSSSGPPSVETNQQPSRADVPETVETGSPQSETSPQLTQSPPPPEPTPLLYSETHTPTQNPQSSPGGDVTNVGGFKKPPPFSRNTSRAMTYRNTANYPYRFDDLPSLRPNSDPPHYEFESVTGGVHAEVWPIYNKISEENDKKMLKKWNSDLDVLLIFVSAALGLVVDSDRTNTFRRLPCSLLSSPLFSSKPWTI